ncbi:MAG: helix-turn-helix transcriptional regulator [Ruminococcus sp.]|nr:helix-turn-helix transcriptional regulator [Ruminococcus sp.]
MKHARERAGLTIRDLAAKARVEPKTISVLENDYRQGQLATVVLLADALNISIDEYIGREVKKYVEYRVKYDHIRELYIVYANGKEIGTAFDIKAIGDVIHFWEEKNEYSSKT